MTSADSVDVPLRQVLVENLLGDLADLPATLVGQHAQPEVDPLGQVDATAFELHLGRDRRLPISDPARRLDLRRQVLRLLGPPLPRLIGDRLVRDGDGDDRLVRRRGRTEDSRRNRRPGLSLGH